MNNKLTQVKEFCKGYFPVMITESVIITLTCGLVGCVITWFLTPSDEK